MELKHRTLFYFLDLQDVEKPISLNVWQKRLASTSSKLRHLMLARRMFMADKKRSKSCLKDAKENAPTILFLDEVDAMIPDRSANMGHHYESEVNEWLIQMNNCAKNNIFIIIGATNRLSKIDKAVLRSGRFDRKVYVPLPDHELRMALFELEFNKRKKVIEGDIEYTESWPI